MTRYLALALIVSAALISNLSVGHATGTTAKFHGKLMVIECSVNGDVKQAVKFGDAVGIHRIDGTRYKQPVPFIVDCTNYAGGDMPAMTLTLEGTATSFDEAAVTTDIPGLGIELQRDGVAQPLNKAVSFDYNKVPVLSAVPVLQAGTEPEVKTFSATVKLKVEVA